MNHKHGKSLHALLANPVRAKISSKSVDAAIGELGGEIEEH
ncbi:MAG: hypothetical protein VW931_02195 [Alphaproteobacteria bacterium]